MKLWRITSLFVVCVLTSTLVLGATATVTLDWDGKDSLGVAEQSLPITISVNDADTGVLLTTGNASGAVTGLALPSFNISVPDNTTKTVRVKAKATDSVGNASEYSTIAMAVVKGADTLPPTGTIMINGGAETSIAYDITATISATDAMGTVTGMKISEDGTYYSGEMAYATAFEGTFSGGLGVKTLYVKFKDDSGNWSEAFTDTITIVGEDTTPPGVPVINITVQ